MGHFERPAWAETTEPAADGSRRTSRRPHGHPATLLQMSRSGDELHRDERRFLSREEILAVSGPFKHEPITGTSHSVRSLSLDHDDRLLGDAVNTGLTDREVVVRAVHRALDKPHPTIEEVEHWPDEQLRAGVVALARVDPTLRVDLDRAGFKSFRDVARARHDEIVAPLRRSAATFAAFGTAAVATSALTAGTRAIEQALAANDVQRWIARIYDQMIPRIETPAFMAMDAALEQPVAMTDIHRQVAQFYERAMPRFEIPEAAVPDLSAWINRAYRDLLPKFDPGWLDALAVTVTSRNAWHVVADALDATAAEEPIAAAAQKAILHAGDAYAEQLTAIVDRLDQLIDLGRQDAAGRRAGEAEEDAFRSRVLAHLDVADRDRRETGQDNRLALILAFLMLVEAILRGWVAPAVSTKPSPPAVGPTSTPSSRGSDAPVGSSSPSAEPSPRNVRPSATGKPEQPGPHGPTHKQRPGRHR